jgi:hypothetical protein
MSTSSCTSCADTAMIKLKKIEWPSFAKKFIASWLIAECLSILIGLIFLINEASPNEAAYLRDLIHGQGEAWQFSLAVIGTIFIASTACSLIFVPLVGLPLIVCLVGLGFDGLISFALCSVAASIVIGAAIFFITSPMVMEERMLILALVFNFCVTIMLSFWKMYRPAERRNIER